MMHGPSIDPDVLRWDIDDTTLVNAARRDRRQFALLYERYVDRLFRYARVRVGSADLAADVVSEAMMNALDDLEQFDLDRDSFAGWLFAIAARAIGEHDRQRSPLRRLIARLGVPEPLADDALDDELADDDAQSVRALLMRLPSRDRELLFLCYGAGLTSAEIAAVLYLSVEEVERRLARVLERLSANAAAIHDLDAIAAPDVDALLRRTLGVGALSRERKRRHLQRLGIQSVTNGGQNGFGAPLDIGRSRTVAYDPSSAGRRPRLHPRDIALFALVAALIAALLPALTRSSTGRPAQPQTSTPVAAGAAQSVPTQRNQVATGQAEIPAALPSPTPNPPAAATATRPILVAVSQSTEDANVGYVTAWDASTGGMLYRIQTGANPDAVLSPDGARLYVASLMPPAGRDEIVAYEAATGAELRRLPTQGRVRHVDPRPSGMAVSHDGSRLFIYSYSSYGGIESHAFRIQLIDVLNARLGPTIEIPGCTPQLYPSADDRWLYVVCRGTGPVQVINLENLQLEGNLEGTGGWAIGSALSSDGRWLYILSEYDEMYSVSEIDTNARSVNFYGDVALLARYPVHSLALVALSPDGSTLFYGMGEERPSEEPVANQVWTWNTAQRQAGTHIGASPAITGATLAAGPDAQSVFAVRNDPDASSATILHLDRQAGTSTFAWRNGEQVLRIFSGQVVDAISAAAAGGACPVTPWDVSGGGPRVSDPYAYSGSWLAADGIWVGLEPTRRGWVTGENRVLWWRQDAGELALSGRRLDAAAGPMEWSIAGGDQGLRQQLTYLHFPSPGCWEVTGV